MRMTLRNGGFTKADILRALERLPMNAEVVAATRVDGTLHEIDLRHAFTVTGRYGVCLVLAETCQVADHYADAETVL
jgi:hypothetical protein